jgi:hypothetical protein
MRTLMQTVQIQIEGLGVSGTVRGVRSALECIRGVERVTLAPGDPRMTVTYDAHTVRPAQLATAVRVMGCEVGDMATPKPHSLSDSNIMLAGARLAS